MHDPPATPPASGPASPQAEATPAPHPLDDAAAQFNLAVDLAHIAVWRHDLRSQRMHYNARAFEVLDIPVRPDGLSMDEVRSFIHPEDLPRVLATAQQALASGKPTDMAARYRRADGSWRHVLTRRVLQRDADGQPLAFMGVALDVTDQTEREQALHEAHERIALTTQGAGIGTWERQADGTEERWDAQMYHLRGLLPAADRPPALLNKTLVHPDDRPMMALAHARSIGSGQMAAYEFRVRWPDGSYRWLASRSVAVRGADGQLLRELGVNWDVHERVSAETARRDALVAQRESEAKSRFLSRMSHELRTPLNAVLGFTQLLAMEASAQADAAAAERRQKLDRIQTAGQHLLSLINDVLDLSSLESGELRLDIRPVPLQPVLVQALDQVAALARQHGVPLFPPPRPVDSVVMADPERLGQVLVQLLSNGIKFNRPGGHVSLQAEALPAGDRQHGPALRLTVSDTGRGLDSVQQLHLFEPFNRLGAERDGIGGTGMGLAVAKALLDHMGGSIRISSAVGHGTSAEVQLPMAVPDAATPATHTAPAAAAAPAATPRTGRLLYIEDNPVNVLLMEELVLQRAGLQLHCEAQGRQGIAQALRDPPDLVLVDMQLPDIDGLEVLRQLRADPRTTTLPCIALSANAMPDDVAQALAAGFTEYWTKPLNFSAFLQALDRYLPAA